MQIGKGIGYSRDGKDINCVYRNEKETRKKGRRRKTGIKRKEDTCEDSR